MIYYSVLYPPLLPITIPAFEVGNVGGTKWRLYFEPSVGNKISDFKGGFVRIRSAESEVSLFQSNQDYPLDMIPFRNPFAEYVDPYTQVVEGQPSGYRSDVPVVKLDPDNNTYYVELPESIFNGRTNIRHKVQIMLTKDWLNAEKSNGRGKVYAWDEDGGLYVTINKNQYFGGNLVQKGLSEWSRVSIVSPVTEAKYELVFNEIETSKGEVGFLNSPILEMVGQRVIDTLPAGVDGNALQGYKIEIYSVEENKPKTLVDSSGWIVGQENKNIEIRWQNIVEIRDKTYYFIKLEIQTIWDLRKEFWQLCYTNFETSIFRGDVRAINDHDKARVKIVINNKSPLTWGARNKLEVDPYNVGFVKVKDSYEDKTFNIEQGIDLSAKNGSFAGEIIATNIEPIQDWEEDETRYFLKLSGPEVTMENPYQEEYLLYAHSKKISSGVEYEFYEEDVLINPVLKGINGEHYELTMSTTGHIDFHSDPQTSLGQPGEGTAETAISTSPSSHNLFLLLDDEDSVWRVSVSSSGTLITNRDYGYEDREELLIPTYLYDRHNKLAKRLSIRTDGVLELTGRPIEFDRDLAVKPMYINEFRLVKKVWGLQLGTKTLIGKQTYKAFMNDFNRKLGKWLQINPNNHYYIYFASTRGQLFLYVSDITARELGLNFIDRYNLHNISSANLPTSSLFLTTEGLDINHVPIRDEDGRPIKYAISIDEKGSLVANVAHVGTSTSVQKGSII